MTQVQKVCISMTIIYHEYSVPLEGCSVIPQGTHYIPHMCHDTPMVLNIPKIIKISPIVLRMSPIVLMISPMVLKVSPMILNTPTLLNTHYTGFLFVICFDIWKLSIHKFHHMIVFSEPKTEFEPEKKAF